MLLREEAEIVVRTLKHEPRTNRAILVFYVRNKKDKSVIPGPEVVAKLKEKLRQDSGILQLSVANVETVVCQSKCSGTGFFSKRIKNRFC